MLLASRPLGHHFMSRTKHVPILTNIYNVYPDNEREKTTFSKKKIKHDSLVIISCYAAIKIRKNREIGVGRQGIDIYDLTDSYVLLLSAAEKQV